MALLHGFSRSALKKATGLILLTSLSAVFVSISVEATEPSDGRWIIAGRALDTPVIDGNLSEWPQVNVVSLNAATADTIQGEIPGLTDSSGLLRAAWDANTL